MPLPLFACAAGNRGSNLIVGGLFLHQQRRQPDPGGQPPLDCSGRFANLRFECQAAEAPQVSCDGAGKQQRFPEDAYADALWFVACRRPLLETSWK